MKTYTIKINYSGHIIVDIKAVNELSAFQCASAVRSDTILRLQNFIQLLPANYVDENLRFIIDSLKKGKDCELLETKK